MNNENPQQNEDTIRVEASEDEMEEEEYGPEPMDQSFIPDTIKKVEVKGFRQYEGTPAYLDTTGLIMKRPLSRTAFELLKQFPFLKDYNYLMTFVESKGFMPDNDFEAFLIGQAISAKQIQEQVKSKEEMFANEVHAASSKETAATWYEEWQKAEKKYADLREHYSNLDNNPKIVQELVNTQNENTRLTRQNNQLLQQYNELQQQNQNLQQQINGLNNYYSTLENNARTHQAEINDLNNSHNAAINGYSQQVTNLQSQVASLQMQVNILREENKQKMESFMARNKLRYLSNSSDIAATKHELLRFIDGVLGIYDSAIDGVDNLRTAVNKTYTDVINITNRTLDISPNFENVKFPKFKDAKKDAEKLKDKLENKYKVEEESVADFIDKGKLPDFHDNGESSFSPY